MRTFVICAMATVALSGCVAKDGPTPPEPEYVPAKCLWTDDALRQRAFVDDFAKEPLLLPAWQRRPIVIGNRLVDPATGVIQHVLTEHDPEIVFHAYWMNPIEFGRRGQHLGSTQPTSWPVAKVIRQDDGAIVQARDPGGNLRWERQLLHTELLQTEPTLSALVVRTDSHVQGLSWRDGRTLWASPCTGSIDCYDDSYLCFSHEDELRCVRIVDGVLRWKLPVSSEISLRVRAASDGLWLVTEGFFDHEQQTVVIDDQGRVIHRQAGLVAGAARIFGTIVIALRSSVLLLGPSGRVQGQIKLGVDHWSNHAQIATTGDGRAVVMFGSGISTGENWTALIDPVQKSLVWSHRTPRIVPEHDAYRSHKHVEIRAGLVYVVTVEFTSQTIEVIDLNTGELLRYWAY